MAEGIMKDLVDSGGEGGMVVSSAGTWACVGESPPAEAMEVCAENGIDISRHRAKQLTDKMVRDSDHILVMEGLHLQKIIDRVPEASGKVRMLGGFTDGVSTALDQEIPDPYGGSASDYRECFEGLKRHIEAFAKTLCRPR
jgi:protein-tyrosine phosphatase